MPIPLLLLLAISGPADEHDDALDAWFSAEGRAGREACIPRVLATEADCRTLVARLRAGRSFSADVPRGRVIGSHDVNGVRHPWMVWVPESYDPERRYAVRFDLHGGMGQPEWKELDGAWSPGWAAVTEYRADAITVLPAGWWDSMWWEHSQVLAFEKLLEHVRRTWNVDENRVVFVGGSDGGVAAWFYAMRWADPWASYVATVGHPARLTARVLRADGQLHLSNLNGQRLFAVNGARDRIISAKVMRQYVELFRERTTLDLDYREHAEDGHGLYLTAEEESVLVEYLWGSRRDPYPDEVDWATERVDRYARRAWLVIDALDEDRAVEEENVLPRYHGPNVPRTRPPEPVPWGRVILSREGNLVRAQTTGVSRFTLLLSEDEFDLDEPVEVEVNGETVFERVVPRDRETLLRWAARDDDRTRLFVAEIAITCP